MKVNQFVPQLDNRVEFSFRYHKFIPSEAGCYVLAAFDNEVLYVGLTEDLHGRFFDHRSNKEKCSQTPQGAAFWFYYLACNEKELNRIERTWLNQHYDLHGRWPVLNKVPSPVR